MNTPPDPYTIAGEIGGLALVVVIVATLAYVGTFAAPAWRRFVARRNAEVARLAEAIDRHPSTAPLHREFALGPGDARLHLDGGRGHVRTGAQQCRAVDPETGLTCDRLDHPGDRWHNGHDATLPRSLRVWEG